MTTVLCNLDFTTNCSRVKGYMFTRCDLKLRNRDKYSLVVTESSLTPYELISVYPYWLDTVGIVYLGLL